MSARSVVGRVCLHRLFVSALLALCLVCVAGSVLAQTRDVPASKDHPMIKRFEGSAIIGYEFKKFNDLVLLLGPVKGKYETFLKFEYEMERSRSPLTPTKTQTVEGQSTRILYVAPPERSPLEVLRNYEQELQKNGFEPLFKCSREQCTQQDGALGWLYLYPPKSRLLNIPPPTSSANKFKSVSWSALSYATDQHYLSAKRTSPGGDAYVSVYSARGGYRDHQQTFEHPILLLEVIDAVPMENKMVTVDAAAMAKEVAATGHVALYGILFDTDKTDIKPESVAALEEIAKFLKADPKVGVYIVGHTDNVGGFEHNMSLSLRRAEAVVKELTTKYGVSAPRLKAVGTGPVVPLAPNDTDEGRAKNRRVELVKQ